MPQGVLVQVQSRAPLKNQDNYVLIFQCLSHEIKLRGSACARAGPHAAAYKNPIFLT